MSDEFFIFIVELYTKNFARLITVVVGVYCYAFVQAILAGFVRRIESQIAVRTACWIRETLASSGLRYCRNWAPSTTTQ